MDDIQGKTISIISNADVRYVGIIDEIDGEKGTISITKVRVFGTEERVKDPSIWILPSTEIHDKLVLSGDSVKGLNILETPIDSVQPVILPEMFTFAMMKGINLSNAGYAIQPVQKPMQSVETPSAATNTATVTATATGATTGTAAENNESRKNDASVDASNNNNNNNNNNNSNNSKGIDVKNMDNEFNFEENNAKFNKEEKPKFESVYNKKSSFFDDLSSTTADKTNDRIPWNEEKVLNENTFGESKLNNYHNRRGGRGGRGGRGRGGRGGRGRGRGGNNNFNNYNNYNNNSNYNTNSNNTTTTGTSTNNNRNRNNNKTEEQPEWLF